MTLSQSSLPYSKPGTIYENGDDQWNENEINIINYEIASDETLTIELFTSLDADLWVFYGDFNGFDDIDVYGSSSRLLAWSDTVDGYASFSYTHGSRTDKNIAIFSYNTSNPSSMSYELYSSIEESTGSAISTSTWIILIVIALIIFYLIRSRTKSKKQELQQEIQYGQTQPSYQQPRYQGYQEPPARTSYQAPSSQSGKPEYQQQTTSTYCENCGSENMGAAVYCTTCGGRVS